MSGGVRETDVILSRSHVDTPTLLVVDDTAANLQILMDHLGSHGLSVLVAQDGEETLLRAQLAHPDLILLDVMMPGMSGFDTCRRLKGNDKTKDIPVIFMTALSDQADKIHGFEAGGVDYITKPFQLEEVLARVNTHLTLQRMQQLSAAQNQQLRHEIAIREQTEAALARSHRELEERVAQRTAELADANAHLIAENAERRRMEGVLRESEARIRRLIESNIIGIMFWNLDGSIGEANDAFLRMTGYARQDVASGRVRWTAMTPEEYLATDRHALEELRQTGICTPYEKEYIRRDGSRIPVLVGAAFFEDSRQNGVGFALDLSERKAAEQRALYIAHHDALTGLANRVLLQDRLIQAIANARREKTQLAVIFIDLDDFKRINDSLGHDVGDRLLQTVAVRLQNCLREGDNIARLGGDEFVLSMPVANGSGDVIAVARKALHALESSFRIDSHELHVSGSIGISLFPLDGSDVGTLLRAADTAMYHAKENGRNNYQFFTPALNEAASRRLAMENRLRHAMATGEFILHFQPQLDMASGAILSSEALLRWKQPGEAPISCGAFIAIAEDTGLIIPIGEWVLRQACAQLKSWRDLGYTQLRIAVNLSPRQFFCPDLPGLVEQVLHETGLPASALDLELTESALLQNSDANIATLQRLSSMGIQLSIDDFGTGYSSLAYLQRYPVNALKIDQSFVAGIACNANDRALVSAIVAMAKSLQLKVLAEGVETSLQADFLREQGCPTAQGFYYSEAVPPEILTEMLRKPAGPIASVC
jgi:diguanylate cyclase (GGDEF)-like protein/PAS domain S-box-containing protein